MVVHSLCIFVYAFTHAFMDVSLDHRLIGFVVFICFIHSCTHGFKFLSLFELSGLIIVHQFSNGQVYKYYASLWISNGTENFAAPRCPTWL